MAEYSRPSSLPQVQSLSQTSEEGEEEQSRQNNPPFIQSIKPKLALNDGPPAVAEGANRRPCSRPPGSKNKPKPAVVLNTRDGDNGMNAAVLEIAAGSDVIDMVVQFGRRCQLGGVTIMSAFGSVLNITLCNPISHTPSLTLHSKLNIISITGTFLGSSPPSSLSSANCCSSGDSRSFGITLGSQQRC
ncbi:hypothetical protein ACSBR2_033600 [Camellia fascicularis]